MVELVNEELDPSAATSIENDQALVWQRGETVEENRQRILGNFTAKTAENLRPLGELAALRAKAKASASRDKVGDQSIRALSSNQTNLARWTNLALRKIGIFLEEWVVPALANFSEWYKEQLPPNWRDADYRFDKIEEIVSRDGIPIVWVPRAEIVTEIMRASDRENRAAVLVRRGDEVADDCSACLDEVRHKDLEEPVAFAWKAVGAWRAGHEDTAQALAAIVTEALITKYVGKYQVAVRKATTDWNQLSVSRLRMAAAVAPIVSFYTPWWPNKGLPPLKEFSRHMTIHSPCAAQYNPENCTIAVMLLCSLLREIDELIP